MTDLISACMAFTKPFEGKVPWLYKDGSGNITGGIGHLFGDAIEAAKVFGVDISVMQSQWDAVDAAPAGKAPASYETLTESRLTEAQMSDLFRLDLGEHIGGCGQKIPGFDSLPVPIRIACVDIDYNVSGGIQTFPAFLAAVASGDWPRAAVESHRLQVPAPGGVQAARNVATRNIILSVETL